MEAGDPGKPMAPVALRVVEEQKSEFDPVTVHSPKMVVKTAQDRPQKVLAATQTHVLLMEAGAPELLWLLQCFMWWRNKNQKSIL